MFAADAVDGLPAEAPVWRRAAHHPGQPLDSGLGRAAPVYCCSMGAQDRPILPLGHLRPLARQGWVRAQHDDSLREEDRYGIQHPGDRPHE
eukprot:2639372-Pyramimonas_sp.AAC.1